MLFDYDPFTGIREDFHTEEGKIVISKAQDVESMLDHNQIDRNNDSGWKGDMHKVASIPLIVCEQWIEELKALGRNPNLFHESNKLWFVSKLNNSDWGKLRTKEGVI